MGINKFTTVTMLLLLCLVGGVYLNWQTGNTPLVIGPGPSFEVINGRGEGYFRNCSNRIEIVLSDAVVERLELNDRVQYEQILESVQLGLAGTAVDNHEIMEYWGGALYVNDTINPGEELRLGQFKTSISTDSLGDISNYWFILKTDANGPFEIYTSSIAESEKNVIAPNSQVWCMPW